MKKITALIIAAVMIMTSGAISCLAAEAPPLKNFINPSAWEWRDGGLNAISGRQTVKEDGTIDLLEGYGQWQGIYQVVDVSPSTRYTLTVVTTLSAGRMRADWKDVNSENWTEGPAFFPRNEDWSAAEYNKVWTQSFDIDTGAAQTKLALFIRNSGPYDEDPWYSKAVGVINEVTLTTEGVYDTGDDPTPGSDPQPPAQSGLIDPSAWVCQDDEGNGKTDISVGSDGTVVLSGSEQQWLHLVQTVSVRPNTKYNFEVDLNLEEGSLRADFPALGIEMGIVVANQGGEYGQRMTFRFDITTAADMTSLEVHLRNNGPTGQGKGTIYAFTMTAEGGDEPVSSLPAVTASISDAASDGKIDHLYLNAAISASETRDVGIIFSDTEASCAFGANPLFIRVAEEGHGKSANGFIQSGCYGDAVITAVNLGGEEGDSVIAVYWQDMPTNIGTLYARTFAKNSDDTYD
ncbi:MAG: hypothetical protein J6Z80_01645, partial [Clostridia bacterium]|nr:hypothetical protein [Clostridia bacterium]